MTAAPQAGLAARFGSAINTHINKITKNGQKLTWVLIIGAFDRLFDNFKGKSAPKSRIHWFYCYIYSSITAVNRSAQPHQPGPV